MNKKSFNSAAVADMARRIKEHKSNRFSGSFMVTDSEKDIFFAALNELNALASVVYVSASATFYML